MKRIEAFDGRVTFVMTGRATMKQGILQSRVQAHHDLDKMSDAERYPFTTFAVCVGSTDSVEFAEFDDDTPDDVHALREFWTVVESGAAIEEQVRRFLLLPYSVASAWWEARDSARPAHLLAPEELTENGAKTDDPNS